MGHYSLRWFVLIFFIVSFKSFGQDERYFHKLFDKRLITDDHKTPYKWKVPSKVYKLDLDQDGAKEGLAIEYRDQDTWLSIYEGRVKVFSYKLVPTGLKSKLFRVRLKTLSPDVLGIVLYFYEGYTKYLNTHSVSRFYFGAILKGNLRKIKMIRGPHFFEEREDWLGNYDQNSYGLHFFDYNGDGIKDISVKSKLVSRVYFYSKERRRWLTY
jgi:hypothetical protein